MQQLVNQTTYLEIANTNAAAASQPRSEEIASVSHVANNLESRLDKLVTLMERTLAAGDDEDNIEEERMNFTGNANSTRNSRNHQRYRRGNSNRRGGGRQQSLKCRVCDSTDHLFRKCPNRFCQSCGNKGHDGWQRECPKYQ